MRIVKSCLLIACCLAVCLTVAGCRYRFLGEASARLYVMSGSGVTALDGLLTGSGSMEDAVKTVLSDRVVNLAAEKLRETWPVLDSRAVRAALSATVVEGARVIKITCRAANSQLSADMANTVAEIAAAEIRDGLGLECYVFEWAVTPAQSGQ